MTLRELATQLNDLIAEDDSMGEMEVNISIQTKDSYDTVLIVSADHIKIAEDKIIIS